MILTVKERGQFAATMRYVNVWLMETLASWVPTSPEMEVKLQFGEHLWDAAQHADAFGKRTFELRLPLQHSLAPQEAYLDLLAEIRSLQSTDARLAAIYDVVLPGLDRRYKHYMGKTDTLADAPTVRILERHVVDIDRMLKANIALLELRPELKAADGDFVRELCHRESASTVIVESANAAESAEA